MELNVKETITNTITETLKLLNEYKDFDYINKYYTKFKRMYKNLYECIKSLNNIWNIMSEDILLKLYDLVFSFKDRAMKNNDKNIVSFSDGLIDIIFDIELFKKYDEVNSMNLLFVLISSFLKGIVRKREKNVICPLKNTFFWKIINFTQILEKSFTINYQKKIEVISSFFQLLDTYFYSIKDDKIFFIYFKQLLHFSFGKYQNNLIVIYNFLCFIQDMVWNYYTFDEECIKLLIKYSQIYQKKDIKNIKEKEEINIKDELLSVISCILFDIFLLNNSSSVMENEIIKEIQNYKDNEIIMANVIDELKKFIKITIEDTNENKNILAFEKYTNNAEYYMKLYGKIFDFIIFLFQNIVINNENEKETNSVDKIKNNKIFINLNNFLRYIEEELRGAKVNRNQSIYCLINFLQFYHFIIFNEPKLLNYLDKIFVGDIMQIINACSQKYHIINSVYLFNVKINNVEIQKTILEIIFDIFIQYFKNDIDSKVCNNVLLSYIYIFYDNNFKENEKITIFYLNDYIRNLDTKKKIENENSYVMDKYKNLSDYKETIFKKTETFKYNFTTYFLLKIEEIIEYLEENSQNFKYTPINELKSNINSLFDYTKAELGNLYTLNKKFFFGRVPSPNNKYHELIKVINSRAFKKDPNKEIEIYFEKIKKTKDNKSANEDKKENKKEKDKNLEIKDNKKDILINDKDTKDDEKEKNDIENKLIEFPKDINRITFFDDLDKTILINPKKEIMNNIFSIYYKDILYYNETFCRMRDYYINTFLDSSNSYIKQLDYPSKIKNYTNNLESPLFVKQCSDYFNNPIFPISHSYIKDHNKKIINNYKTIKLLPKEFPIYEKDRQTIFECELIKIDYYYYGNIIVKDSPDCLLFQEEEINLEKYENEFKYMFLISYFSEYEKRKNSISDNFKKYEKKRNKKKVVIFFDEIEEIVERRALMLWKAIEIYMKNGKSYLFNFTNVSEFENFKSIFTKNNMTKSLVKKKQFFKEQKIIMNDWEKGLINNYEYILLLNKYSSRSFNDSSQYPICPWLLSKYENIQDFIENKNEYEKALREFINKNEANRVRREVKNEDKTEEKDEDKKEDKNEDKKEDKSEPNNINNNTEEEKPTIIKLKNALRKFKYPPGLQENATRIRALSKFESEDDDDDDEKEEFKHHSGCHYSTSAFVFFYLMRQQPFCDLIIKLQGYDLENTNRCFINITGVQAILANGNDNRELIPELFSKIEYFLNLNCDHYGYLANEMLLDDAKIDILPNYKNDKYQLSVYVRFIIEHKKILNSKIIGYYINKWIDNVFGKYQLPPENMRKESYNVFPEYTYEQTITTNKNFKKISEYINEQKNLNKKSEEEEKGSDQKIKEDLNLIINYIVNFGQTPYQLFDEGHHKLRISAKKEIIDGTKQNSSTKLQDQEKDDIDCEFDIESTLKSLTNPNNEMIIKHGKPLYFLINPSINKILVYIENSNILILKCELFNKNDSNYYNLSTDIKIKVSKIFINDIHNYRHYIYNLKYSITSFDNINNSSNFNTFYTEMINDIIQKKNIFNINNKKFEELYLIMTSRHLDFSFKIYIFYRQKKNLNYECFSFICEDFVSSCCAISKKQFIIGLKNGKLIAYSLKLSNNINNKKSKNKNETLGFKAEIEVLKYIQGHQGEINVIEIDKNLGIVITCGKDNYLYIRKIYDFDFLLSIKFKSKYNILMAKTSSFHFLYILCYNKIKNQNVIFGYTLAGLKFAKSEYETYENICFTESGNLVTINNKKEIIILSGSDLSKINVGKEKVFEEFKNSNWTQFDFFLRKNDDDMNKIMTFFDINKEKGKKEKKNEKNKETEYEIRTLDVKNIKCFD